jgi:NAD(P)-dependent dehydrogenase (short-subunit alcohol dehydrogenase family)
MNITNGASSQKTILITGGNKGIGFGMIQGMLKKGNSNKFILTSRNEGLGQDSLIKLKLEFPERKNDLIYHQLDITNKESVDNLFSWIKRNFGKVDVFVNNAGIIARGINGDKKVWEDCFSTNVYATIDLSERIVEDDIVAENGKIIIVGSELGDMNRLKSEDLKNILRKEDISLEELLNVSERYEEAIGPKKNDFQWNVEIYAFSKLIDNTYARILSKKNELKSKNIAVYGCSPGYTATDLNHNQGYRTLEHGCETPIYVVELPDGIIDDYNGKFFYDLKTHNFDNGFIFEI